MPGHLVLFGCTVMIVWVSYACLSPLAVANDKLMVMVLNDKQGTRVQKH